jgi:hypothetical protein
MRWYAWVVLNYPFILGKTKRQYEVVCMSSTKLPPGTEAARGAEGAPAPPTACVIKELFFSFL